MSQLVVWFGLVWLGLVWFGGFSIYPLQKGARLLFKPSSLVDVGRGAKISILAAKGGFATKPQ